MLMAVPSRVATRLGSRSLAGVAVLSVVLAFSPTITVANSVGAGAYLGYETPALVAKQRRRALMLLIVFGNASALTLLGALTDGPVVTNVFLLLFMAAFAHNVMRYRRLRARETA